MKNFESLNYFLLYENCKAVKGESRSVICDLQLGTYTFIPNSLVELLIDMKMYNLKNLLEKHENDGLTIELLDEYLDFLEEKGLGHYVDSPDHFPEVPMTLESPNLIHDCIIEWSDLNENNFYRLLDILNQTGCRHLEIRCYDSPNLQSLKSAIQKLQNTKIKECILYVKYKESDKNNYESFIDTLPLIGQMVIHNAGTSNDVSSDERLFFYEKNIDSQKCCGNLGDSFNTNLRFFIESNLFNPCLNKKFSIDKDGHIKNCPSLKTNFGNYLLDDTIGVIKNEIFQEAWHVRKDQISVCKTCEFRYICGDCRAFLDNNFSKPKKCNYNPKTMSYE